MEPLCSCAPCWAWTPGAECAELQRGARVASEASQDQQGGDLVLCGLLPALVYQCHLLL